ncbi:RsmB/NOP family class I SAM-dependent RNA methyltransferase [Candidatus Gracilibacteria bacterium]|nr:RsmB/NOP family class I SAM-dependent RNA methyltransferase [Candidatus Gracilibacteria bacterium]
MNEKFINYFKDNFFDNNEDLKVFLQSLHKHIKKSIRVNTNKISVSELLKRLKKYGYETITTFNDKVFYVERGENYSNIEKRLGFSLEHLFGYFYIQELGASSSVFYLADGKIDNKEFLILDMASSPGGKTTQLGEYYPNSFIVANEISRDRTPQLISNIERMGSQNIGVTCYNGQFIGRMTETFDKILLDAPCSGEGIVFKSEDTLKYWNIKNVTKIGSLQQKLFEAGLNSLKIGGEMLYSTCTMNKIENEGIIENALKKYPESFRVVFQKRFWPHIDETGGFFVCKIVKLKSIDYKINEKPELSNTEIKNLTLNEKKILDKFCDISGLDLSGFEIFKYIDEVLILKKSEAINKIKDRLYFIKFGQKIGKIEKGNFTPNYYIGRDFELPKIRSYIIKDDLELDNYLRGAQIGENITDEVIQIKYDNLNIGLGTLDKNTLKIKNLFPIGWRRK